MSTDEQKADVVERLQRGVQEHEVRWAKHDAPTRHWDIGGADDAMREAATTITALQLRIKELEVALRPFAEAPAAGLHGGPMVIAHLIYEDGTYEDTARHRGMIDPVHFRRARSTLKDSGNGSEVAR